MVSGKAITSAAAMQLVEQGKLVLDEPIANILPELARPQVLEGFDAAGEPRLRPARRAITLRHLITHTSGFVYDIWNPEMGRYMERKDIPGSLPAGMRPSICRSLSTRAMHGIMAPALIGSAKQWRGSADNSSVRFR